MADFNTCTYSCGPYVAAKERQELWVTSYATNYLQLPNNSSDLVTQVYTICNHVSFTPCFSIKVGYELLTIISR